MKATLVIPRPPVTVTGGRVVNSRAAYHFPLRWTTQHPASSYGLGVLLTANNEVFDGFMLRHLRESVGAWLQTDDPERVAGALGVEPGEPGIRAK